MIEELPAAQLFGPHGADVCRVIEIAGQLDLDTAVALGRESDISAQAAYTGAWRRWIAGWFEHPRIAEDGARWEPKPDAIWSGSPINAGFSVLWLITRQQALRIQGPMALAFDDEGEDELAPVWSAALNALCGAAMAFGAPALVMDSERAALTRAWRAVIGRAPSE